MGKGIYSLRDASKLSQIHLVKINRWIKGLKRKGVFLPPVIPIDYEPISDFYSISFLDLMELFFVNAFRKHGVSFKHGFYQVYAVCEESSLLPFLAIVCRSFLIL